MEKPTPKQISFIRKMCDVLDIDFEYEVQESILTKEDASKWISDNMHDFKNEQHYKK